MNYTWQGVTSSEGQLTQTTVARGGFVDVPSFTISGRERDSAHLIEDEPAGGGESYHKDELYANSSDWSGGGSRSGGVYAGTYHVNQDANFAAHNKLAITDQHSAGTTEEGEAYDLVFNDAGDRATSGTYHVGRDYDDNNYGALVAGSNATFGDGSVQTIHSWGTRSGEPFNSALTTTESHGGSAALLPPTRRTDWTLPAVGGPLGGVGAGLMLCKFVPPTTPPTIPLIRHPLGGLRPGAGLLQGYYNNRIAEIGENAKTKVGKLVISTMVMQEINQQTPPSATGTFVIAGAAAFAQGVGQGKELDNAVKAAKEYAKSQLWTGITVTTDVECVFYVQPRPAAGQDRSGKCVVQYRMRVKVSGTKGVVPMSLTHGVIGNYLWFNDDNLKTATLAGDP